MIRSLATLAQEGSPVGDVIRQNETLSGSICIGLVLIVAVLLVLRSGKK